jgi:hypothetical protein
VPTIHGLVKTAAATLALALIAPSAAAAQGIDMLPDLDQQVPTNLSVKRTATPAGVREHLGFDSAAANVGDGDLRLLGYRRTATAPTMRVNQIVDRTQGDPRVVRDVGVMSYVVHPDHKHWHLLGFERYELRRPGASGASLALDQKTGFCLGDRFAVPNAGALPGFSPTPLLADTCGLGQPNLTGIFAGISVGYADVYKAHIEGQYIDVTALPQGRYVLTHTVNTDGLLAESDLSNNASSVLFRLTRRHPNAVPRVQVLRTCPQSESCQ